MNWTDFLPTVPVVGPALFATQAVASELMDAPSVITEAASRRAADIDALNVYIQGTPAINDDSRKAKDEWIKFYNMIGWYDKTVKGQETFDKARNLYRYFILANAKTPEIRKEYQQQLQTGVTAEEQEGGVRRADTSGFFPEENSIMPFWLKVVIGIGIIGGTGLVIYRLPVLLLTERK
jgi:hypothetical protein